MHHLQRNPRKRKRRNENHDQPIIIITSCVEGGDQLTYKITHRSQININILHKVENYLQSLGILGVCCYYRRIGEGGALVVTVDQLLQGRVGGVMLNGKKSHCVVKTQLSNQ
jgi:hypothetical protein